MAGKITDLTALTGANLATGDLFEVLDVSDTTLAATGTNKKITASELAIGLAPKFTTSIVSTIGTITADAPALNATQTWNDAGIDFSGFKINVTNTASGANSVIADFQLAGVSKFSVDKNGDTTIATLRAVSFNVGGVSNNIGSISSGGSAILATTNSPLRITLNGAGFSDILVASGTFITAASIAGASGLRLPHGTAPSAPTNGDMWTTTAGLFIRINGSTIGPLT